MCLWKIEDKCGDRRLIVGNVSTCFQMPHIFQWDDSFKKIMICFGKLRLALPCISVVAVGKCVRCLPFIFCFAFIILLLLLDPCERKVCPMSWLSLALVVESCHG